MTSIKELLHQATTELPPPHIADPLPRIRRAALGRQLTAVAATAAMVAAAIAFVVTLPGGDREAVPPVGPIPATNGWSSARDVHGVAVGFHSAWLGEDGSSLVQADPVSGDAQQRIPVPGLVVDVRTGAGAVWVLFGERANTDQSAMAGGQIEAFDPDGMAIGIAPLAYPIATLSDATRWKGSMWVPVGQTLLRLTPSNHGLEQATRVLPHVATSVMPSAGRLWVSSGAMLRPVTLSGAGQAFSFGRSVDWTHPLFAAAPLPHRVGRLIAPSRAGVWTTDGSRLIDLEPALLHAGSSVAQGIRLQTSGRPFQVATANGGIFVATTQGVDFFNWLAVLNDGVPTDADLAPDFTGSPPGNPHSVVTMAADGVAVLIVDAGGTVTRWVPHSA